MTKEQIAWAMRHDWYENLVRDNITGECVVIVKDDMIAGNTLGFINFEALKQWAGY
jgi:hypothetical protein